MRNPSAKSRSRRLIRSLSQYLQKSFSKKIASPWIVAIFVSACSGWSELYKPAPPYLPSPVVTLHTYSGIPSSSATHSTNTENRTSSLVSTVTMGLREFTKRASSARFSRKAGTQIALLAIPGACNGLTGGLTSFDKAVCLASNY